MKNFFIILTAILAIFNSASIAPAEDGDKKLRDIIKKAIQAQGAGQQAASKATIVRGKGTWRRLGNLFEFTGEWAIQPPQRAHITIETEMNGAKFKRVTVLDGDRGWSCLNDGKAQALSPEEMAAAKAQLYAGWVASLTPLEDRAFSLTALSVVKVGSRPSVGIRVSRKDNPAVDLFFDKETGLLLKSEVSFRSARNGQEVAQSMYYLDYKDIGTIKYAMKRTVQRDDKRLMEVEYTDVQWRDKLDDRWFAKP